jgi:RNA polymerase sigma-70 factor (ECF subfamily)
VRFGAVPQSVDTVVLSNLDVAYRLARWHFRKDAEAIVHEASLRAFRQRLPSPAGTSRAWFLRLVSRVCDEWRERKGPAGIEPILERQQNRAFAGANDGDPSPSDLSTIDEAIRSLPARQREVLVLRDLEGLSYQELAEMMGVPVEAVMASLSRSRQALSRALAHRSVAV